MTTQKNTMYLVKLGLMIAIVVVVSFVPVLGYVPLVIIKATTVHIPVIIGAILLGPRAGALLGLTMGITSIIKNTMEPAVTSFVFSPVIPVPGQDGGDLRSLIIAIVPRVLIGVTAALVYRLAARWDTKGYISCGAAGVVGSLVNTALVLGGIYLMFGEAYATAAEVGYSALGIFLIGIVATNGLAEAALAMVLSIAIARPLMLYFKYREQKNAKKQEIAEQKQAKAAEAQTTPEVATAAEILPTPEAASPTSAPTEQFGAADTAQSLPTQEDPQTPPPNSTL